MTIGNRWRGRAIEMPCIAAQQWAEQLKRDLDAARAKD
jgi:hypothetical protein